MKKLDSKAIGHLIAYIRENLSIYAGEDENERVLIKPGLKMVHVGDKKSEGTGLVYTVDKVFNSENGLLIKCIRYPDISITLTGKDLKQFERA